MDRIRVLLVCMGNICRSPMAHGVLRDAIDERGWAQRIEVDSAGTHDYHVGEPPDPRAQAQARLRGHDLSSLRARRLVREDFETFDYVLVMDDQNHAAAAALRPAKARARLEYFLDYGAAPEREVPDPYYGGANGFALVLDLVTDAANGFLDRIGAQHNW